MINFSTVIAYIQGEAVRPAEERRTLPALQWPRRFAQAMAGAVEASAGFFRSELAAGREDVHHRQVVRQRSGRRLRATAYGRRPGRQTPEERGRRRRRGALGFLPAVVMASVILGLGATAFLAGSSAYINVAAQLPDAQLLAAQPLPEDTVIYSADSVQLADLHPPGYQHYYEPLAAMGQNLPNASIAIEDSNFYHEGGLDLQGIARAAWVDWREHQTKQGASTITQQLVKLRLLDNSPTFERKLKEAVLAIQVDRTFTKQQILEMYLNTVFYGHDAYGGAAASQIYFHVPTAKLDLAQAAMLAGIPQNPTYNNPFANWEGAKVRQRQVLDAMVKARMVSGDEADKAYKEDLSPPAHMFTPANVIQAPGFVSYVTDQLVKKYGQKATYTGGFRVVGTLNWTLQTIAQKAITDQVNSQRWRKLSQGALVAIDPHTGAILAMVGSADPTAHGGQYNMAVVPRNPGSSFKIYNYTAAIASGRYTMVTPIADTAIKVPDGIGKYWEPKNYDGKWHGTCQLQACMGNSLNVPAVKVELGTGVANVVNMARLMGAPPFYADGRQDVPPGWYGPSLTLGGYGETVVQMATGASVLGAQGVLHQPYSIKEIKGSDGSQVFKADPGPGKQVLDPKVAFIMEQIMSNDNNRAMIFGRHSPLTLPGRHVGAKTGTTDNFTDGWTIGYTPDLAAAVWMGNPDFSAMVRGSDGVFVAAPAWHNFMQRALDTLGIGDKWFGQPAGLVTTGGNWFLPGTGPSTPAPGMPPGVITSGSPKPGGGPKPPPGGGNGHGHGGGGG